MRFKRIISIVTIVCVFLASILSLFSCTLGKSKEKFTKIYLEYFDTVTNAIVYAESQEDADCIFSLIESRLRSYHELFDIYNSYEGITNLHDVNLMSAEERVSIKVDARIADLLEFSRTAYEMTEGYTNVCLGSVLKLWHDKRELALNGGNAELPDASALLAASAHTDIGYLTVNKAESLLCITDPYLMLDVGAVAKGYATEMIALELESLGYSGFALSVGGNVRVIGDKPDGSPWSIGVEDPFLSGGYIETLSLSDKALVTSGSYQRFYKIDGVSYHHIIDKDTLYPANEGFVSVSVVAESSAVADALSTALFCMSADSGLAIVERISGVEAIWITDSGERITSSGFNALVKNG